MIYASWVPTFLELNAVGFYLLLVKQVVYVYCECHIVYFYCCPIKFFRLSITYWHAVNYVLIHVAGLTYGNIIDNQQLIYVYRTLIIKVVIFV